MENVRIEFINTVLVNVFVCVVDAAVESLNFIAIHSNRSILICVFISNKLCVCYTLCIVSMCMCVCVCAVDVHVLAFECVCVCAYGWCVYVCVHASQIYTETEKKKKEEGNNITLTPLYVEYI